MRFRKRLRKLLKKRSSFPLKIGIMFILFIVGGTVYALIAFSQLPSLDQFSERQISQSTKIYDRTGEVLLYEIHGEEKRTVIPFEEIPEFVKQATLAAEDSNFYTRPAFDVQGIARALITNIKEGRIVAGGSTITQQLVRNVYLTPKKTIDRKLKELFLAIRLESKYTKNEVFSAYLNQIPYGSNAYGVEAASQVYFGKPIRNATLEEAAMLAAIIKAPSYFSPWGPHKDELLERKNHILERMVSLGFIKEEEKSAAQKTSLQFALQSLGSIRAPHFSLMVRDYLISTYGESLIQNGGLKVITTLNWDFQEKAEKYVAEGAKRNTENYESKNAALVAQDPKTGQVLALVGSRNYFDTEIEGNFNVAAQGLRQPGSALKPFVYMTAFQKGYMPKTMIFDVSTEFDARNLPEKSYRPENFDHKFRGPLTFEEALAQSRNIPAVKVLYLAGFDDVLSNLHAFGITTLKERWRYGLSLTLGSGEVKLIDIVNAYATMSQEGVRHEQKLVLRVEDVSGNVLEEYRDEQERVTDPQYPRLITKILSSADLRRPLFGRSTDYTVFPSHDVALKTGSSEDYRDAWVIGYTPSLVVGVWAGNNENTPMKGISILAAVPIWSDFLKSVIDTYPLETFTQPEEIQTPTKPMLNGKYIWQPEAQKVKYPQIHSILYYVDKKNPLGSLPDDPSNDPQFINWESSVIEWAKTNISDFYLYNKSLPQGTFFTTEESENQTNDITVSYLTPKSGDFVKNLFTVEANITSPEELSRVDLYFNGRFVYALNIFGRVYRFQYYLANQNFEPQNTLELRVTDVSGKQKKSSIVVFRE